MHFSMAVIIDRCRVIVLVHIVMMVAVSTGNRGSCGCDIWQVLTRQSLLTIPLELTWKGSCVVWIGVDCCRRHRL
jgi:hypothetical protein